MTGSKFEQLIQAAGLNLISSYAPRFIVSLHIALEYGVRVQCDVLAYEPAEFAMLTPAIAQYQVEACKKRLIQAANTQQGVLAQDRPTKPIPQQEKVVRRSSATVNYPAH